MKVAFDYIVLFFSTKLLPSKREGNTVQIFFNPARRVRSRWLENPITTKL
jgi:hypothetical protein